MHVTVAIVTMAMVNAGGETNLIDYTVVVKK